ncbi:MAG: hypothetical protein C0424_11580 [Sphingobacteriaceae bacterium]|nr:hypothetical protein [Sphingobacteriaceae bacterium]
MKKLLLIFLGLGFGTVSQAQTYSPMAADSTLWKVYVPAQWSVYGYLTMGTVSYFGRSYFKLYGVGFMGAHSEFAFKQATSISQIGLLRELDKKVYYVPFNNGIPVDPSGGERLLYDFDVAEGDTVYSELRVSNSSFGSEQYYIATNFDTTNGVVSHQALVPSVDSNFSNSNLRERIMHGVGLDTDPFGPIYGTAMMANRSSSMTRGADIFNQYFPVGIMELLAHEKNSFKLYPNPATDELFITGVETLQFPLHLSIYDVQGKEVSNERLLDPLGQNRLDLSDLPTGLFQVRLTDAAGRQEQLRFVKR